MKTVPDNPGMVIYYATVFDSTNIKLWSGLGYYMGKTLQDQGFEVYYLNKLNLKKALLHRARKRLLEKFFGQSYSPNFSLKIAAEYAASIKAVVPEGSVVMSPNSVLLAMLGPKYHTVLYTDCTFNRMVNFYPSYTRISQKYLNEGNLIEQAAIKNAGLLIYSSQWAADSAEYDYGADPAKISVVSFGSNLAYRLRPALVYKAITQRTENPVLNLLFIGVSWHRKGGDYALALTTRLNEMGIKTILHIVGIRTLPKAIDKQYLVFHGYVSKTTPEGQKYLAELFKKSHFLVLPSRADCTPVVVSEASSFALPTLISNVGANGETVVDGINGHVFDFNYGIQRCVDSAHFYWENKDSYRHLCLLSYKHYKDRLNWATSGKKLKKLLTRLFKPHPNKNEAL